MFTLLLPLAAPLALAQDAPPLPPEDAALRARLDEVEAQLAALKAEADEQAVEDLLREAEALADTAPPPPPTLPRNLNAFNPRLTAFGDALATYGVQNGQALGGSGLWLRSLEFDIRADVDPFAKAVAILSIEREPPALTPDPSTTPEENPYTASPEEVYVDLVALPAHLSARVGQFRMPFGIANRSHPHDYPWTDQPLPINILGGEGYADMGAVMAYQVHNPWDLAITLQGGVTGGKLFDPSEAIAAPGWIGRAEYFGDLGNVDFGIGASATGQGTDNVAGTDLMIRWKENSWHSVVLMAEALRSTSGSMGGYAALQIQPTRPLYLGLRADALDGEVQYGGFASYYTSEFLRARVGAMVGQGDGDAALVTLNGQLTFVWGSHPAEPYWVNR